MAHHGQKVTTDPESTQKPIYEGVGTITSDSLAGESLGSGGHFGENNPKAVASKQSSAGTNTNNTDISNATRLDPAVDAQAREAQEGWDEEATLASAKGLGRESGVGPTYNNLGSSVNSHGQRIGVATTSSTSGQDGVQGNIAPIDAYAHETANAGVYKAKGKNITEDENLTGRTVFGKIGSKNDAGRVAEQEFAKKGSAVGGGDKGGIVKGGEGAFKDLDRNEEA